MRLRLVDNLAPSHHEMASYLRLLARLSHASWAAAGGALAAGCMPPLPPLDPLYWQLALPFAGLLTVLVFQACGLYSPAMFERQWRLRAVWLAWSLSFALIWLLGLGMPALWPLTAAHWLGWYLGTLLLLLTQRAWAYLQLTRLLRAGHGLQRTVILGRTESGSRLAQFLQENADFGCQLLGYVDDRNARSEYDMPGIPCLGGVPELIQMVRLGQVQQVVIALPWSAVARMGEMAKTLRQLPINVLLAPDMVAFHYAHHRLSRVAGLPMFNISEVPLTGFSPLLKRCEDILLASLCLLLLAPLMLLLALCIKLDSPGPVLFRQKRYGYNNRLIEVYKFRSMFVQHSDATACQQTIRSDPRVTRVGRIIRKTSLDELPQLLNVLYGSMSMVGPRPHATETKAAGVLFEDAVDQYIARHRVKPGITGWAQVNGYRGETDTLDKIEKRVEYDLEYIENWSLWFDLYILVRTLPAVLHGEQAY